MDVLDIRLRIAYYLYNKDLASCVRLSRSWHASLVPTLYRTFNFCHVAYDPDLCNTLVRKYGQHIRYCTLDLLADIDTAAAHVTALESLKLENLPSIGTRPPALHRSPEIWQSILRLAHSNPRLQRIIFARRCWAPTREFLEQIAIQCPSLKELAFYYQVFNEQSTLGLFRALTRIENVSFLGTATKGTIIPAQVTDPDSLEISSADNYDFSRLKSFSMSWPYRPELWVTPQWIRSLSSIERFDFETMDKARWIRTQDVVECIQAGCWPQLKSLHLRLDEAPDSVMADLLGSISGSLERLSFTNHTFESVEPLRILIDRYAHSLTELSLFLTNVPSRANQLMMVSLPNLVNLRLGALEARDILDAEQGEWACLRLQSLWILICGLDGEIATGARVYAKLARLTRLKELSLGPRNQAMALNVTKPFLSVRLHAGLGQLSALRMLETFVFIGMGYDIGEAEVVWMVEHWRRLRRIHGALGYSRETQTLTEILVRNGVWVDESY
ncbi:hypothetical protein BGZ74_008895 [Mortierella antarctica]|nr:hypothetical protein BGZ74_008895 [Mortierella antarctica]